MDQPTPQPSKRTPEIAPYLLSREYEDHLDWLENQRRDRTRGRRARESKVAFLGIASLCLSVFAFAGALLRRR